MECRGRCAACCIAPSISPVLPALPDVGIRDFDQIKLRANRDQRAGSKKSLQLFPCHFCSFQSQLRVQDFVQFFLLVHD